MLEFGSADDISSKGFRYGLMAKTNSQNGKLPSEPCDQIHRNPGVARPARTGRDHDAIGIHGVDLVQAYLVVTVHVKIAPQLTQVLNEVVGKAVIVIDHDDLHCDSLRRKLAVPSADVRLFLGQGTSQFQRLEQHLSLTVAFPVFTLRH